MSMISSLIDELNKSADEWNGSNMFELARMCREAADTIWELRDDLQRANDAVRDAEHDESMAWDRVRKAEAENAKLRESVKRLMTQRDERLARAETDNAKLRELVEDMHAELQAFCDAQDVHGDNCPLWVERTDDCELRGIERRMRELGGGGGDLMTATDVLRRLLDERGVEWGNIRNDGSESDYLTEWQFEDNQGKAIAIEWAVGSGLSVEIHRYHLTPEQAIAATLGVTDAKPTQAESSGTCHDEGDPNDFCCSECGVRMFTNTSDTYTMIASDGRTIIKHPNYCPECGRRIEQ